MDAKIVAIKDKGVIFMNGGGEKQHYLKLTNPRPRVWRLQSAGDAEGFDDMGAAQILARDLGDPVPGGLLPFSTDTKGGGLCVKSGEAEISVCLSPFSLSAAGPGNGTGEPLRIGVLNQEENRFVLGGELAAGEALYGGGERFNQANQRGKRLDIKSLDFWAQTEGNSYVAIPLVLSSRGYGLFLNRYEHSILDLGAENPDRWFFIQEQAPLDLYIFLCGDPREILKEYSALTGHAPAPPSWLFGIQVCRHARLKEFGNQAGIREMIAKMEENDLPWDAVIAEGWDTYDVDSYGELEEITRLVHSLGKKILLYEPCGRFIGGHHVFPEDSEPGRKAAREFAFRESYLVRQPDGNTGLPETASYNPEDAPNPEHSRFIDITNPEALAWWQDAVWGRLVRDIGIDGCKIDFCEQFPDHIPLVFHDGRSSAGAHQWYPTLYNTLMYRFYQEHRPEGGMCLSRGGGIGAQRYPFLWAGDQRREFSYLQAILTGILSSGLSGLPFMSYDLAAYMPAQDAKNDPEDRVFIRGAEMGCFSSNMQTHGIVTRPYDFPEPVKKLYRIYSKLHQALRPYLTEQAEYACRTGTPLLRHLYLYDPKDPNVLNIENEYMLGNALLAAPVFSMAEARDIYLPRGNWRNILDGKTYPGGQTLAAFPAPFRQIPVFLLDGNDSKTIDPVLGDAEYLLRELR
jgi:alpha-D-xyloside xylohydrolase